MQTADSLHVESPVFESVTRVRTVCDQPKTIIHLIESGYAAVFRRKEQRIVSNVSILAAAHSEPVTERAKHGNII